MSYNRITDVAAGRCLNIHGNNIISRSKNQNDVLWANSGSTEQSWSIDNLVSGVLVKSAVNSSLALNAYRSSTTKFNCDVYPWSGNETDAKVNFEAVSGGYRIKLTNYNIYLTAGGTANGADVYWAAATGSTSQAILNLAVQNGSCVGPGTLGSTNEDVGNCIMA